MITAEEILDDISKSFIVHKTSKYISGLWLLKTYLLLDIVGVNHNFTEIEWDQISTFATNHSKRKSLEEYREELALISPQIYK